jgi:hypothetical protein
VPKRAPGRVFLLSPHLSVLLDMDMLGALEDADMVGGVFDGEAFDKSEFVLDLAALGLGLLLGLGELFGGGVLLEGDLELFV